MGKLFDGLVCVWAKLVLTMCRLENCKVLEGGVCEVGRDDWVGTEYMSLYLNSCNFANSIAWQLKQVKKFATLFKYVASTQKWRNLRENSRIILLPYLIKIQIQTNIV